ncbi:MAG: 4a-hydroxytetrahydrobiopterin dehydratase [Flavobacteriaceae bacterium]|nr:4a-hydroxytetrahydrobiopterin dehydratase [Flavobacteriaceae bacterium]
MDNLNKIEIHKLTKSLNLVWENEDHILKYKFHFKDYFETIKFINEVADIANTQNHHPTMIVDFDRVEVLVTTHEIGNMLTQKDFDLAKAIELVSL